MTHCNDRSDNELKDLEKPLKDVVAAQMALSKEVVKLFSALAGDALSMLKDINMPKGKSCCDIPQPCWMPHEVADICAELTPGGTQTIKITVTNEDFRPHNYTIMANGKDAGIVNFSANSLNLGPKERQSITATISVPAGLDVNGGPLEFVIWVKGCNNYYIRVALYVDNKPTAWKTNEFEVNDTPDYVVHWYDHFYCTKPCYGSMMRGPNG